MRKAKKCRKCGEPITGYGFVCDTCVFRPVDEDRKGQKRIFAASNELEDDMAYVRKLFRLPAEDKAVPSAILHAWISNRTVTRKLHDDWGGLKALHRDFTAYSDEEFTPAAFREAIVTAGYAIENGMVSRLILRSDYESVKDSIRDSQLVRNHEEGIRLSAA